MNTLKRKLTAILSADVAGYSRLMADDEVSTVRTLQAYQDIISDLTILSKPPALPGRLPEFDISGNKRKSPIM